ncbi:unnamed protein product [Boreogadus saida]
MFSNCTPQNTSNAENLTDVYEAARWIQLSMAVLSIVGSGSILVFSASQKLFQSQEVRPLLLLSAADLLLAVSWLVGAALYTPDPETHPACCHLHTVEQSGEARDGTASPTSDPSPAWSWSPAAILYTTSFFYTLLYVWRLISDLRSRLNCSVSGFRAEEASGVLSPKILAVVAGLLPWLLMSPALIEANLLRCSANCSQPYRKRLTEVELNTASPEVELNTASLGVELNTASLEVELNTASLEVELNTASLGVELNTASLEVELNTASLEVELNTASLEVELNTASLGVELNTASLGVELNTASLEVELNTASLEVELNTASPLEVELNTASLEVELNTASLEVELNTASLEVELNTASLEVELNTASLEVELNTASPLEVELNTASPLEVELNTASPLEVELNTASLEVELNTASPLEVELNTASPLEVELNTASLEVELNTASPLEVELNTASLEVELNTASLGVELNTASLGVELNTASPLEVELNTASLGVELKGCLLMQTGPLCPGEQGDCWLLHAYRDLIFLLTFLITLIGITVLMEKARRIHRRVVTSGGFLGDRQWAKLRMLDRRMLLYPAVFIFCWGPAVCVTALSWLRPAAVQGAPAAALYLVQALASGSQGALNSLAYGWTRSRFREAGPRRSELQDATTQTPLLRAQRPLLHAQRPLLHAQTPLLRAQRPLLRAQRPGYRTLGPGRGGPPGPPRGRSPSPPT